MNIQNSKFAPIPFVLDSRTLKPVSISPLDSYSFFNEEEDLYAIEVMVDVSKNAYEESKHWKHNQLPDNFSNDTQLLELVKGYQETGTYDSSEFKQLNLWEQSSLEYDQAVLLSLILPTTHSNDTQESI